MSARVAGRRALAVLGALFVGTWLIGPVQAQPAGGPPIDPRAMSGIPRVDPQSAPGTITVRSLLGSFREPAVGAEVKLELRSQDGGKVETRSATADAEGRASFGELGPYVGGTAVASAELGGEAVRSQPISISASAGVRVLLVKGAAEAAAAGGGPATRVQGGEVPMPGVAFPTPGAPKGSLLIGALDLARGRPIEGVKLRLVITDKDGKSETREALSDARGAGRFEGLDALPADTTLVAEADLPTGPQRSQPFSLVGQESGMAVVLTATAAGEAAAAGRGQERRQLAGPRALPTIPTGTVRATVVGPHDEAMTGVPLVVIGEDMSGLRRRYEGSTDDGGNARIESIPITDDTFYLVEAQYAGAPWRSGFFRMDDRMGVAIELRVFPVTGDVTRIKSAVQFGVEAMENDLARVVQLYQVYVDGDEAYWPAERLRIEPGEGARGMVALDRASSILEHKEEAPFATLVEPIPPGEVIDLSIAYLLPHDGAATIRWKAPFPVMEGRAVVREGLTVTRGAKGPPVKPPHQEGQAPDDVAVYDLGSVSAGQAYELEVEGLVVQPKLFRRLGVGLGLGLVALTGLALALRPRTTLRQRLERRRDALLRKLDAADAAVQRGEPGADETRKRLIHALDQVFRQLDALAGDKPRHMDPGAAWAEGQSGKQA